jgi:hypothetical protein
MQLFNSCGNVLILGFPCMWLNSLTEGGRCEKKRACKIDSIYGVQSGNEWIRLNSKLRAQRCVRAL